jgi:AcrR family transcriptional regulator
VKSQSNRTEDIPTHIKNPELVEQRRRQLIDASVPLFIKNGYHKTTMRQISRATGFSIGLLYEYVTSKEDILYLVCRSIHDMVEIGVKKALSGTTDSRETLAEVIREYFMVCHQMSDHILLMYQVTQFLPPQWKKKVLENEIRITNLFVKAISLTVSSGCLPHITNYSFDQIANNISVLGHQWAFRGWYLARHYTIEGYIKFQTDFILGVSDEKIKKFDV